MAGNRAAAEKVILDWVLAIDPSRKNEMMYIDLFKTMSDETFDSWITAIEEGKDYVSMIAENLKDSQITVENNLTVAKKMGIDFFQRLWLTDAATGKKYLTPHRYLILDLPVRRQIQTLVNKISIPEDNNHVDELTDQPTGPSKGSSISFPELLVLYAQGHDRSIEELMSIRGGNLKAMRAVDKQLMETGAASMDQIAVLGTRAKASDTLSTFLKGMHLGNNI